MAERLAAAAAAELAASLARKEAEGAARAAAAAAAAEAAQLQATALALQRQLTSEATLKNEQQQTLDGATRHLRELQQRSAESSWDGELRAATRELASESAERGRQLEAQRSLVAEARDQLESLRAATRRLGGELSAAQDETKDLAPIRSPWS